MQEEEKSSFEDATIVVPIINSNVSPAEAELKK